MNTMLYHEFTNEMLMTYEQSQQLGYFPTRFKQMVEENGGVETAKKLVLSGEIQSGLRRLKSLGRLDIAMESLMLKDKFSSLFTPAELEAAKWRLSEV